MAQARRKTSGPSEHDEQKAVFEIAAMHDNRGNLWCGVEFSGMQCPWRDDAIRR